MITLKVNGETKETGRQSGDAAALGFKRQAESDRDEIWMRARECGGACTVHIDGEAARSCSIMAGEAAGKSITTIERRFGTDRRSGHRRLAEAGRGAVRVLPEWTDHVGNHALDLKQEAADRDIDLSMEGNICRCGTYVRIRQGHPRSCKDARIEEAFMRVNIEKLARFDFTRREMLKTAAGAFRVRRDR